MVFWSVFAVTVLAGIVWKLFPFAVGVAIPLRRASRLYLSDQLKKSGIAQYIPQACVEELADHNIEFVRELAKRRGQGTLGAKSELLPMLEQVAIIVLVWVRDGRDPAGESLQYIPDALKRYGVPLGVARPPKVTQLP
jgi:hypothetical protein